MMDRARAHWHTAGLPSSDSSSSSEHPLWPRPQGWTGRGGRGDGGVAGGRRRGGSPARAFQHPCSCSLCQCGGGDLRLSSGSGRPCLSALEGKEAEHSNCRKNPRSAKQGLGSAYQVRCVITEGIRQKDKSLWSTHVGNIGLLTTLVQSVGHYGGIGGGGLPQIRELLQGD